MCWCALRGFVAAKSHAIVVFVWAMFLGSMIGVIGFFLILIGPMPPTVGFVIGIVIGGLVEVAILVMAPLLGDS
jgi:hypothetical protein